MKTVITLTLCAALMVPAAHAAPSGDKLPTQDKAADDNPVPEKAPDDDSPISEVDANLVRDSLTECFQVTFVTNGQPLCILSEQTQVDKQIWHIPLFLDSHGIVLNLQIIIIVNCNACFSHPNELMYNLFVLIIYTCGLFE